MSYYEIVTEHKCKDLEMGFYRPPEKHEFLNYNERPEGLSVDTILIHYTVSDYSLSYNLLGHANGNRPGPSVHYMINSDGRIDNLVDDSKTAWHAGKSHWAGRDSINKYSIGIELINPGSGTQGCFPVANEDPLQSQSCTKNAFPDEQLQSLFDLVKCLSEEHKSIKYYLGHGDVAPGRKIGPGVMFPWSKLHDEGFGSYSEVKSSNYTVLSRYNDEGDNISELKANMTELGYGYLSDDSVFDDGLANVVRAFHMHFNQEIEGSASWGDWTQCDAEILQGLLAHNVDTHDEL